MTTLGVSQVVDFYLREDRAKEYAEVVRLASLENDDSRKLLRGYVREAQRTSPIMFLWLALSRCSC